MKGFFTRSLVVLAGIVAGVSIVSGAAPWRDLSRKPDTTPSPPIQRERAPDPRA